MDIQKLQNLPIEEQLEELEQLKEQLNQEREQLKQAIRELEQSLKEKQAHAQNLVAGTREHTEAEISIIVGSVKRVRNELALKNKELLFLGEALKQAEKLLRGRLTEVQAREAREKIQLLIEQLLLKEGEDRDERIKDLQDIFARSKKDDDKRSELEKKIEESSVTQAAKKEAEERADYLGDKEKLAKPYVASELEKAKVYGSTSELKEKTSYADEAEKWKGMYAHNQDAARKDYVTARDQQEQAQEHRFKTVMDEAMAKEKNLYKSRND